MDLLEKIKSYANPPITHQLMLSLLTDCKRPNAKIHFMIVDGTLQKVRKGLYIAGPSLHAGKPESFLLANHIYGPSYVSLESALAYYGLIPERVFETTSMTLKVSENFTTPVGVYSYTFSRPPFYSFGIRQQILAKEQKVLIASPEKALADKIIATAGLNFRSKTETLKYLIENLRIDEQMLKDFNTSEIESWLPDAPKKNSLLWVVTVLKRL